MGIITRGMGAILKHLKKSGRGETIKNVKPTFGKKKTRNFKIDAGIKRLNRQIDQIQELKGKK